jgi:hypothetical protein
MSKLHVKSGTPVGNASLCRGCFWGQFMTGYRESDLMVICTNTNPNIVVPFIINECSEYRDKNRPDYDQMEKLAINLQPVRVSAKTPGFSIGEPVFPVRVPDVDEDEEEVASVR